MPRLILSLLALIAVAPLFSAEPAPLQTVDNLGLQRYQGRWYEIARLPNRFQDDCAGDVRVRYTLRNDGRIDVYNECRDADGGVIAASGVARRVDEGSNSRLEVRFAPAWLSFLPMVWGDYFVIDLDPDYRWAVVGEPEREYFWVLARSPLLDESLLKGILDRASQQGYVLDDLVRTKHDSAAQGAAGSNPTE